MEKNREKIQNIIMDILGVSNLDTSSFDEAGWDSLKHLDIILAIEQEFNINIPIDKIEPFFHSIDNIVLFIDELQ